MPDPMDTDAGATPAAAPDDHAPTPLQAHLEPHLPGLRAFVRLHMGPLLRSRESASDLTQSICREILQHASIFEDRGEAPFRAWLFETARRKLVDRHRYHTRARRQPAQGPVWQAGDWDQLASAYARIHTPSQEASLREQVVALEAAFDELTEDHRRVILLFHVVGLRHAEVAEVLGRSPAATRNLLTRAMARLSRILVHRRAGTGRPRMADEA